MEAQSDIRNEPAGASIIGIMMIDVNMTLYSRSNTRELQLLAPQRSMTRTTNPGKLDNSVARGVPAVVDSFECLIREAADEASLPEGLTQYFQGSGMCNRF